MKAAVNRLLVLLVMLLFVFALPAFAAKGGKEGKQHGKGMHEMQDKGKHEGMHASDQEDVDDKGKALKKKEHSAGEMVETGKGKPEEAPGLIKQREKKQEQERKELGKGSETGQQKREEHSRKWWKFWE